VKQFLGKERERKNPEGKQRRDLYLRVKCLYQKLDNIYGTKGLVLRASKFDAIDLMSSEKLENKVLALQKILQEDPTINGLKEDIAAVVDSLEEMVVDTCSRKVIEEELQKRVQKRMEEKYEDYLQDIKLQIIKEQNSSPENAQTLKKLGQLEKMERVGLNRPALEVLRPLTLDEVVGQNRAIKSLIANLNTPYPQHILLYGPPGVGKTTCARLALEIAKKREESIFSPDAPFIEVDGTTLRWDVREATNPLLGSVHDPIYQGAKKELADEGIPEPKLGLVSEAHGGVLFIDEIGDMDPLLQNKLLKVMEDKRVYFESSYYDPNNNEIPQYIKKMFERGVPADFVLIGATTQSREKINPAFRSRCIEVFFDPLTAENIREIIKLSAQKLNIDVEEGVGEIIGDYTTDGRKANKILIDAYALALNTDGNAFGSVQVKCSHVYEAIQNSRITPYIFSKASSGTEIGRIFAVGTSEYRGALIELEAIAFPAEKKGEGNIRFNDTAGSMIRDSVFNAISVLRKETGDSLKNYDLHINVIGGGKVDGPSAGAAIYLAIFSAVKEKPVFQDVAITGELSIRGRIKPVGGLHEKIYGARQAGIKKILIPEENFKDIPGEIKGIEIIPIEYINQAYPYFFSEMAN